MNLLFKHNSDWFSLNNFLIAKFGVLNLPQSPDIKQSSDQGISNFQISDQSLIKGHCYNSRTSDDMKLRPVTKLETEQEKQNNAKKL